MKGSKEKQTKPVSFEREAKDKTITIRLSQGLVDEIQAIAETRGIKYQRLIREIFEEYIDKNRKLNTR